MQQVPKFRRVSKQPENPYANLIPDQTIAIIPSFELESGVTLCNVPLAYKTYGTLSPGRDNAIVICHALTGSADVRDWWAPLLGGSGKSFDTSRFFVVCINSLGSPYGSASPVTSRNGDIEQQHYGPEFPLTTVRDDANIFKLLLDDLDVEQIAAVVGGSMGGMIVLEFAYFGKDYVRSIVPIATSARYSAWGISWGEVQRQSIYSDPRYDDGYYTSKDPPKSGLGAARMSALLTYRSRDSFESRFGRNTHNPSSGRDINGTFCKISSGNEHVAIHNDGHKMTGSARRSSRNKNHYATGTISDLVETLSASPSMVMDPQFHGTTPLPTDPLSQIPIASRNLKNNKMLYFSAQSYLRYQGEKFIKRFDANCYIAITRKLDTHDVSRGRVSRKDANDTSSSTTTVTTTPVQAALAMIEQPALVLGIKSDGLFIFAEQQELAAGIPDAELKIIDSLEGHDAFLLEFEQVNRYVLDFFHMTLPDIMAREPTAKFVMGIDVAEAKEL